MPNGMSSAILSLRSFYQVKLFFSLCGFYAVSIIFYRIILLNSTETEASQTEQRAYRFIDHFYEAHEAHEVRGTGGRGTEGERGRGGRRKITLFWVFSMCFFVFSRFFRVFSCFFRVFRVFTVVEERGLGVIQREKLPKKWSMYRFSSDDRSALEWFLMTVFLSVRSFSRKIYISFVIDKYRAPFFTFSKIWKQCTEKLTNEKRKRCASTRRAGRFTIFRREKFHCGMFPFYLRTGSRGNRLQLNVSGLKNKMLKVHSRAAEWFYILFLNSQVLLLLCRMSPIELF